MTALPHRTLTFYQQSVPADGNSGGVSKLRAPELRRQKQLVICHHLLLSFPHLLFFSNSYLSSRYKPQFLITIAPNPTTAIWTTWTPFQSNLHTTFQLQLISKTHHTLLYLFVCHFFSKVCALTLFHLLLSYIKPLEHFHVFKPTSIAS
jgi:hypothetical protein